MRVCVVGGGAREHALAAALGRTAEVVVTPGNGGIPGSLDRPPTEVEADLFVVGPEAPLVDGLADRLRDQGKLVLGPGAAGARLEGSKAWMKEFFARHGLPTARHGTFTEAGPARAFLESLPGPYVVKTDGLAAGKGVLVTASLDEAAEDVRRKLTGETFGGAGRTVVVEEAMEGPEVSVLAVCDGERLLVLDAAQDFKREGDGDTGPNTGGMGSYSPVPFFDTALAAEVRTRILEPTVAGLRADGVDFRGVLYAGLMLTAEGPKLVEYNVRFGDPETQVLLPRVRGDLAAVLASAARGELQGDLAFGDDACVGVVVACGPGAEGAPVEGLEAAEDVPGAAVFHYRTARRDGRLVVAAPGRLLCVSALGADLGEARGRAYEAVSRLSVPTMHHRSDIGPRTKGGQ